VCAQYSFEREFLLRGKIQQLKKESSVSIQNYINSLKMIFDELNLIGRQLGDVEKPYFLLNGLGESYESFKTITIKPTVPPYNFVVPQLISYDLRNGSD